MGPFQATLTKKIDESFTKVQISALPESPDLYKEVLQYVSDNKQTVYIQSDTNDEQLQDHHRHCFLGHIWSIHDYTPSHCTPVRKLIKNNEAQIELA